MLLQWSAAAVLQTDGVDGGDAVAVLIDTKGPDVVPSVIWEQEGKKKNNQELVTEQQFLPGSLLFQIFRQYNP